MARNYDAVLRSVEANLNLHTPHLDAMRFIVDALWDAFSGDGYDWVGFYIADESAPEGERLILGPCRDKPACSPCGLHGVCGAAYSYGRTQIVPDVRDLGENHIACDPRTLSEIVVPIFDESGENGPRCFAVLDIDSNTLAAFDESDRNGLSRVLEAAGLFVTPAGATH